MKIKLGTLAKIKTSLFKRNEKRLSASKRELFKPPELMDGVVPKDARMAMDSELASVYAYANSSVYGHESFPGYPFLSELTQRAEYRMLSEKTAEAMVRKWIKFSSKGQGDKSAKIKLIEDALAKYKVREHFQKCATYDGFFGRCQLFIDIRPPAGVVIDPKDDLESPLYYNNTKITQGSLVKFKVIEPIVTYPYKYNASNPLSDDYYNPTTWFVMGQQVHSSRLLFFCSRPLPDILKPAYNFGGMSMSQLAMPYVENWLKSRSAVGRLLRNFSTSGVKTNMQDALGGLEGSDDSEDIVDRAELFSAIRDNEGLMLLDKETEDFFQVNTPLTTVDKLQAQSQEHMASVSSTPNSVLTGITPTGLNASTDGEIRIWYDHILSRQMLLFFDPLKIAIDVIQLSLFGMIDPDIIFEFVSLWQMDTKEMADVRKNDAMAAQIYVEIGALSGADVRNKLATDPESGYTSLSIMPNAAAVQQPTQ